MTVSAPWRHNIFMHTLQFYHIYILAFRVWCYFNPCKVPVWEFYVAGCWVCKQKHKKHAQNTPHYCVDSIATLLLHQYCYTIDSIATLLLHQLHHLVCFVLIGCVCVCMWNFSPFLNAEVMILKFQKYIHNYQIALKVSFTP